MTSARCRKCARPLSTDEERAAAAKECAAMECVARLALTPEGAALLAKQNAALDATENIRIRRFNAARRERKVSAAEAFEAKLRALPSAEKRPSVGNQFAEDAFADENQVTLGNRAERQKGNEA